MKCREAQYWLYSFRPNTSWPADLVGHLQQCPKCRRLHTQLKQIDQGIGTLTSKAGDPSAREQLLARIEHTPQVAAKSDEPTASWSWLRVGGYLTAAAALIALGWFLGGRHEPSDALPGSPIETVKTLEVFRDKIVLVNSSADRNLFAALLQRNARLVQAAQSEDRVEALLDMADDCRRHALTLIEQGPRDSLPMTIELYAQLLREGVLVQLAQAPAENRPSLQKTVRARLQRMAQPAAATPTAVPRVLVDQREVMQSTTRDALERVDRPDEAIGDRPSKKPRAEPVPPVTALVQFALLFSAEADPVARAECCADYVQRLMPSMMLYLAEESSPQGIVMGQQFGEMIQFGIYTPLEVATAKEPAQPVKAQAERIFQNAEQTVADMEKNLEQAPDEARAGWERALEATKKSRDKNRPAVQGKTPRSVQGVLKKVDGARNTITVTAQINGKQAEQTFALTKDVLKLFGGNSLNLADLKAGMGLRLTLSEDRRMVIGIRAGKEAHEDGEKKR